ncbi:MAG: NTP transferase domain-containing protein [Bacteroidales bacterium]|nr:NTP transferase domain-containing protein [Bacteroidales bacterium]
MHYAIIAAGEGSRLQQEGVREPKPLVKLNGEAMIDRLVRIFLENNALSISIIVNREMREVQEHIAKWELPVPLHLIVKSTPSSMHSFHALSDVIEGQPFCLTTVDTIFMPEEFGRFIRFVAETENYDGVMGVTSFVDDEKPLWVKTNGNDEITAFLDNNDGDCCYVSGGIYCLGGKALDTLNACMENGVSRMRNYQRALLEDGNKLKAWNFCKIMDIDHAADIKKAEQFLQL